MIPDDDGAEAALRGAALREAKCALRAQVQAARDAMPAPQRAAAGAFELQIVPQVPAAAHDLAVDAIVTETPMIAAAGA
jgi:5-formyltetrahydrofolate cyclo-ligase